MRSIVLLLAAVIAAHAADISGTWKATAEGPNGAMERTFTFKQDGEKLTGKTVSSMVGESTITDGKVTGNDVTFTITINFGGDDMKVTYKGKINGNEIKFESDAGGNTFTWTAKKTS